MNSYLTEEIKKFAYDNGADLVGISGMERFKNAPIKMSPIGIMPTAKSVIVCAIHHPDAAMQLGGEVHPQDHGPYRIQYVMNEKLDQIAFRMGNFIESLGYNAVPIASSNIWRYRGYKELTANFAPDMSHIYAAVCAGLSQVGWNGLSLTPEYGSWNRFISIITDAPLDESPLYTETKLCDMCGQCIRHCPTDAYRKECHGVKELVITDSVKYKMADKNLWRCAWGEHFNLDLDLPIPEEVTEEVLIQTSEKYGYRDGEMGCCQKYCLPKALRIDGGDYTSTYIRKRHYNPSDLPVHRRLYDDVVNAARNHGISEVVFLDEKALKEADAEVYTHFPHAKSAIVFAISNRKDFNGNADKLLQSHGDIKGAGRAANSLSDKMGRLTEFTELDICRLLEDKGFDALNFYGFKTARQAAPGYAKAAGFDVPDNCDELPWGGFMLKDGEYASYGVVLTSADFSFARYDGLDKPFINPRRSLTENLVDKIKKENSDMFSIIPASRLDTLADKLKPIKGGEKIFKVLDKNIPFTAYDPVVAEGKREIRKPGDYLKGAKNVIIFGLPFPKAVGRLALKPPAEAVGPYVFATYEVVNQLEMSAIRLTRWLHQNGYRAVYVPDLTGIGGDVNSPRGFVNDAICNSLEAVEAGLGALAKNGVCYTKKHGFSQRFMAIITDADLDGVCSEDEIPEISCQGCNTCIDSCPACALSTERTVSITLNGRSYEWIPAETSRCEWAKKFALSGEEGHAYTGSKTNVPLPDKITPDNLAAALKTTDKVLKRRPTVAERCIVDCPMSLI